MKETVDKIVNLDIPKREKIDQLLKMDAEIWCNTGADSSKAEKETARKLSRIIYRGIKELDLEMGTQFLRTQDTKDGLNGS